jgi:hypothetical protein
MQIVRHLVQLHHQPRTPFAVVQFVPLSAFSVVRGYLQKHVLETTKPRTAHGASSEVLIHACLLAGRQVAGGQKSEFLIGEVPTKKIVQFADQGIYKPPTNRCDARFTKWMARCSLTPSTSPISR